MQFNFPLIDSFFPSPPDIFPNFGVLLADPPWPETGGGKIKRGADRHYDTMSVKKIRELFSRLVACRIIQMAVPSHCYIWVTNNFFIHGLELMEMLGYRFIHPITWAKTRRGLGQYRRGQTEHILFGVVGGPCFPVGPKPSTLLGGALIAPTVHSAKPDIQYQEIEQVSEGPYLEIFSREPRIGWWSYGTFDGPRTAPYLMHRDVDGRAYAYRQSEIDGAGERASRP